MMIGSSKKSIGNGNRRRTGRFRNEFPPVDLLIASVALVYDLTVVTHNTKDFQHVPDMRLDDWLIP